MKKYILYLFFTIAVCFLFNNTTKAFVVYSDSKYTIDEEFIYKTFKQTYEDFSFEDFPYVSCTYRYSNLKEVSCGAIDKRFFDALLLLTHHSSYGYYSFNNQEVVASSIGFTYDIESGEFTSNVFIDKLRPYYESSNVSYQLHYNSNHYKGYTNYDISLLPGVSDNIYNTYNTKIKKLDFSNYIELEFDENLFNNNEEFKEVCVNNYDKFGIVSKKYELVGEDTTNKVFSDRDFIWFKHGITGLKTYLYDSNYEDNVNPITEDSGVYGMYATYYWLDSYNNINNIFNHEDSKFAYMLEEKGYTNGNIYDYYNYSLHPFINYFNNIEKQYMFSVFYFEDPKLSYLDATSQTFDKYCFYVRNEYDIVIFQTNEYGDITGDITILEDTNIEINTTINKNNTNVESKFSGITNFISSMKDTMNYINSMITTFFNAMPKDLKDFIIISFTLLIVILIMAIGGYK